MLWSINLGQSVLVPYQLSASSYTPVAGPTLAPPTTTHIYIMNCIGIITCMCMFLKCFLYCLHVIFEISTWLLAIKVVRFKLLGTHYRLHFLGDSTRILWGIYAMEH